MLQLLHASHDASTAVRVIAQRGSGGAVEAAADGSGAGAAGSAGAFSTLSTAPTAANVTAAAATAASTASGGMFTAGQGCSQGQLLSLLKLAAGSPATAARASAADLVAAQLTLSGAVN